MQLKADKEENLLKYNWHRRDFALQNQCKTVLTESGFTTGTHNDPGEDSADVPVMSVQPLPSILVLKRDTTGFETRLLRRGWRQRRELIWQV